MKRLVPCVQFAILAHLFTATIHGQDALPNPNRPEVKSYAMGLEIGTQLLRQGFVENDLDPKSVAAGIQDVMAGNKPKVTDEQLQAAFQAIEAELQARMQKRIAEEQAKTEVLAGANAEKAKAFLAENGKKDGVKSLPSGLQYKVLKSGTGKSPTAQSTVSVHYTGKLIDGKVFDSSVARGQPAQFGVGQVIRGWTEGLQQMRVGDKWMLYIPPELGYGRRGSPARNPNEPPAIGPNEALIFEVELLEIVN